MVSRPMMLTHVKLLSQYRISLNFTGAQPLQLISSIDQNWLPIPDEKILNLTWKIQHKELFCLL